MTKKIDKFAEVDRELSRILIELQNLVDEIPSTKRSDVLRDFGMTYNENKA